MELNKYQMSHILSAIFLSPALTYVPEIFFGALLLFTGVRYYAYLRRGDLEGTKTAKLFGKLVIAAIGFKILYAGFLTWGQYVIWKAGGLSSVLLTEPLKKIPADFANSMPWLFDVKGGYFSFYSFNHFWLEVLLTLVLSFAFYFILLTLKKKNPRFLTVADARLGLVGGIAAGWPGFVVFFVLFLLFFLALGFYRQFVLKEEFTPVTEPLFAAAFVAAAFGFWFVNLLGLSVLKA